MISNSDLKKYNKKADYSYTFGMFPTFELLKNCPGHVEKVLMHSTISEDVREKVTELCREKGIEVLESSRLIEKLRDKESCLLIGVLDKYDMEIRHDADHIVLVNPSDSGNVGTILRTALGFGIRDIAIIEPAVDIFSPKTIRASMGAMFSMRVQLFPSFDAYRTVYGGERTLYPFMLKATKKLGQVEVGDGHFGLIFGNEATGLDESFLSVGQSVIISHSSDIDSLNLSLATGIAIYEFTRRRFN